MTGFIEQANATARPPPSGAPTSRRGSSKLPGFLRELRPLMADLGGLRRPGRAGGARPQHAPGRDISRGDRGAGPVLEGVDARPSTASARPRKVGRPVLHARRGPLVKDLRGLRRATRGRSPTTWTGSPRAWTRRAASSGSMDFLYFSMLAVNGYDGHRALPARRPARQPCTSLRGQRARASCSANFTASAGASARPGEGGQGGRRASATPTTAPPSAEGRQRPAAGRHRRQPPGQGPDARGQAEHRAHRSAAPSRARRRCRATTSRCSTTCWGATGDAAGPASSRSPPARSWSGR